MKRFLVIFALLFFSCVVFETTVAAMPAYQNTNVPAWTGGATTSSASDTPAAPLSSAQTFASGLTPPSSDYSVTYLGQIFGTVGNVLQGTSGQILGQMFYVFNMGVLVVAALWLAMTTIQTVIRGATEGSFMGANKNVHFMLLRIALGFGLVLPSSTTGYSIFQDLYMKVVIEGVALADQTWDAALNYITLGGQVFMPPKDLQNDAGVLPEAIGNPPSLDKKSFEYSSKYALSILADEICMLKSAKLTEDGGWRTVKPSGVLLDPRPYYFTSTSNGNTAFSGKIGFSDDSSGVDATHAGCGSVEDYYNSKDSVKGPNPSQIQPYSQAALKSLVQGLLIAAQYYVDHQPPASTGAVAYASANDNQKILSKYVMSSILNYVNFMTIYQKMTGTSGNLVSSDNLSLTGMLRAAKEQGWITAGGFYWVVEQANSTSQRADISKLVPTVVLPSKPLDETDLKTSVYYFYSLGDVVNQYWTTYVNAQQNTINLSDVTSASESSGSNVAAAALSGNALGVAIQNIYQLNQSSAYNPIVILMHEGNNLLIGVVTIWTYAITISVGLALFAGICNSTSPAGLAFKVAMSWIKSIMMLVTSAMLIPGAILAYYLPMYPFAVFTFASIGWFAMVIEGMAAAPLVCFGMTHPEGHDFLGKGEQALMLILGIFLRPTLLVMGLIAFMLVSFVAFELFLAGFGPLLNSFRRTQSGALNDDLLILISITMMLVIFGFMVMEVVEQSAKIIYQLPNNIMRWIGAPQMGEEYGQMAAQLKGSVSTAADVMGKGAQGVTDAAGGAGDALLEEQRRPKEDGGSGSIKAGS